MSERPVYLDCHATTPVDARVLEAMLPYFTEQYGNPGSTSHVFGWAAKEAVDSARASIARNLGAAAGEIVFTSGATESNNLALKGVAERGRRKGNHLVSVTTEHKAVLDPLAKLARLGFAVTLLPVAPHGSPSAGMVTAAQVAAALRPETLLVSVMLANNEVGNIQPLREIAALCHAQGVLVHTDATQAVGKIPVNVVELDVDLLSFSAHKIYGPKGVGGLYVRRRPPAARLESQMEGGGQESGLRSGTLNVPGIVGLAQALEICVAEMETEGDRLRGLRNRLFRELQSKISQVELNGPALEPAGGRLPGNLNVNFANVDGEALMMNTGRLAVSSGAACTSANPEPSHVLRALGLSEDLTRASLRFGLGRFTTAADIEVAVSLVSQAVHKLRALSPFS